jgi:hypothetical protein
MSNFVRAYHAMPGDEELLAIEGIVLVDSTPVGSVSGVRVGVCALVGEFADMRYAVSVNPTTGAVTTFPQPQLCFSPTDILQGFGGFDPTIGKFGAECGNAFVDLQNKPWASGGLVLVPVNLCSAYGCRFWRSLPTCKSATDYTPTFPMQGASVAAATEFKSGNNRVKIGTQATFLSDAHYAAGLDGTTLLTAAAATLVFSSTAGGLTTIVRPDGKTGVKVGDIVVIGSLNAGAGTPALLVATQATQYRVTAVNANGTDLTVQHMAGTNIEWSAGMVSAALPWRIHAAATADTGGEVALSGAGGAKIPCRPLDATVNAATALAPTIIPLAQTGNTWDALSGLAGATHPAQPLTYTAAIQAPNAANAAGLDALYAPCLDALKADTDPMPAVSIVFASRKSATIAQLIRAHCLDMWAAGRVRVGIVSPSLATQTVAAYTGDSYPGVGAQRDETVFYTAPGVQTNISAAVGLSIAVADGNTTTDGQLDVTADAWLACLLTRLGPEFNPGQAASPVPEVFARIVALQRGAPTLDRGAYEQFRRRGVAAMRIADGSTQIQSGVTSSLVPGRTTMSRIRMFGFIARSLGIIGDPFVKLPITEDWEAGLLGEVSNFLGGLRAEGRPGQQRINSWGIQPVSGDTDKGKGIYRVRTSVRTLESNIALVFDMQVGPEVRIITNV